MLRFLVRRILAAVLTLFAISVTVFGLFFLGPADPAASMCGSKACTPDQHDHPRRVRRAARTTKVLRYATQRLARANGVPSRA